MINNEYFKIISRMGKSNQKIYLGLLGDPAKEELYSDEFFEILKWDESHSTFALIGASESNIGRKEYKKMFERFKKALKGIRLPPIPNLTNPKRKDFTSHIGLFPSALSHLIKGPSFTFDPIPINTRNAFLKFKAKFLGKTLNPFLPFIIHYVAYHPLSGKAAVKTKAKTNITEDEIVKNFQKARKNPLYDWFYLEGGSGGKLVSQSLLQKVLKIIQQGTNTIKNKIVPQAIYGGGIDSVEKVSSIVFPEKEDFLIPEIIIVGNVSEKDISTTYKIVEKIAEANEIFAKK